jgi:hypothetical protein
LADAAAKARGLVRHWPWLVGLSLLFGIAAIELGQLHQALGPAHPAGDHAHGEWGELLSALSRMREQSASFAEVI